MSRAKRSTSTTSKSPGLGDVFPTEVEHALTQVETFPEAAQPLRAGVRRRLLHVFPDVLLYSYGPTRSA